MKVSDVPFLKRFFARLRIGTRPSTPEGTGDAHWNPATTTLSLANTAGTGWVEYDLSDIGASAVSGGGTGFAAYTLGDILIGNAATTLSKLGVSGVPNGYVLTRNNAQPLGVSWASSAVGVAGGGTGHTTYTEGDLLVGNASNALDKLGVGSNGDVLTVDAGVPTWAPAGGGGGGYTIGCKLNLASGFVFNGSATEVDWDTEVYDTDTMFDLADPERITINTSGKYAISAAFWLLLSTGSTNAVELSLRKNGSSTAAYRYTQPSGSTQTWKFIDLYTEVDATATDYFSIQLTTSVNTTTVQPSSNNHTEFIVRRVG